MKTKVCSKCGEAKTLDKYYKHKKCFLGVRPECRGCGLLFDRGHRIRVKNLHKTGALSVTGDRFCPLCEKVKSHLDYRRNLANKDGMSAYCRSCYTEKDRQWRKAAVEKRMVISAKQRCKANGMECTINHGDISIPKLCPVLGIPLIIGRGAMSDNSPSLDRIDNTRGYTPDNVMVISKKANSHKYNGTPNDIRLMYEFYCLNLRNFAAVSREAS